MIIHAHDEPKSFNGAMKDTAERVLQEAGHTVEVSDLYAMKFNPVGGKHDFTTLADPDFFKYGIEQTRATEARTFAANVVAEPSPCVHRIASARFSTVRAFLSFLMQDDVSSVLKRRHFRGVARAGARRLDRGAVLAEWPVSKRAV